MGFPLIKLASLFLRRINAPLSKIVKKNAKESPKFRKFCWKVAEFYEKRDTNVKTKLNKMGVNNVESSKSMTPETAVNLGAEVVEEVCTYAFIIGLMYLEFIYASRRKAKKEADTGCRLKETERKIVELEMRTELLNSVLREKLKAASN